jgi:hypothetical protein
LGQTPQWWGRQMSTRLRLVVAALLVYGGAAAGSASTNNAGEVRPSSTATARVSSAAAITSSRPASTAGRWSFPGRYGLGHASCAQIVEAAGQLTGSLGIGAPRLPFVVRPPIGEPHVEAFASHPLGHRGPDTDPTANPGHERDRTPLVYRFRLNDLAIFIHTAAPRVAGTARRPHPGRSKSTPCVPLIDRPSHPPTPGVVGPSEAESQTVEIRERRDDDLGEVVTVAGRVHAVDGYPLFLPGGDPAKFIGSPKPLAPRVGRRARRPSHRARRSQRRNIPGGNGARRKSRRRTTRVQHPRQPAPAHGREVLCRPGHHRGPERPTDSDRATSFENFPG